MKGLASLICILSLAFAPLASPTAIAAAPVEEPISLTQALQRAVAGNLELQRDRVTIRTNEAQLLSAQGLFDFQFTSSLNFQRSTQPPLTAEDIASGYTNDLGLDIGLLRQLETGGQLRFSLQNDAFNTNQRLQCGTIAGPSASTCTYYNSVLGLTFTHPLLQGLGSEIAQANIRRLRVQKDIALLNRQMRAANVVRDIVTGYWELAYASQDLAIRRSAVDLAREQLRITKAQIDVGRLAPVDAAAVERAIGDRMQDVATSEQNRFNRNLDLRRLMGVPADPTLSVFAALDAPLATPRDTVDAASEIKRALEMNPQLQALRTGLQLSAIDVQVALDTLKPALNFVGTVGSRGRRPDFLGTLAQAFGLDDLTWSAALNLQLPVENRVARGQVQAAQLGAEGTRLDAGILELTIRDSVMRLAISIQTASQRVELAKRTVGFAQQNLDAEKARFQVGRSTNNDVLLRQQELKNAEISVIRATVDLLESEAQLSALTAEVLDRYGVMLKGI